MASKDRTGTEDFEARAEAVEGLSSDSQNSTYKVVPGNPDENEGHTVLEYRGKPNQG